MWKDAQKCKGSVRTLCDVLYEGSCEPIHPQGNVPRRALSRDRATSRDMTRSLPSWRNSFAREEGCSAISCMPIERGWREDLSIRRELAQRLGTIRCTFTWPSTETSTGASHVFDRSQAVLLACNPQDPATRSEQVALVRPEAPRWLSTPPFQVLT